MVLSTGRLSSTSVYVRRFLCLEIAVLVGLWVPGLVFCCLARGRRGVLFETEEPVFEGLVEGFLPLTDGLMAILRFADHS